MNNSTSKADIELEHKVKNSSMMLVFYISIFVLGLLENSLVLLIIFAKKGHKTANEIFVVNLTISDIAFLSFASPVSIYNYFVRRYASVFVCKFVYPMTTATFVVSIVTVSSMAVQRCFAILNPFKPRIKRKTLFVWLAAIWILSFLSVIPQIIATSSLTCSEEWSSQMHRQLYTVFLFALQYVLPVIAIILSYIKIAIYVSSTNCNSNQLGRTDSQNTRRAKEEMAIRRTIITILVMFLLCMLPNHVAYFLLDFGSEKQQSAAYTLFKYVDIPTYLHSCVNPVIYGALSRQFREGYFRYLYRVCVRRKSVKRTGNQNERIAMQQVED